MKMLVESIGLSAKDLKKYLDREVIEFLGADNAMDMKDEFNDILFSLRSMAYAHAGEHLDLCDKSYEKKIMKRLETYGAISKKEIIYEHDAIKQIPIGVVHFAFGNFKQPWSHFDPLKNGTEAEITMLTDNQYNKEGEFTNHLIVTFDDVSNIEFSVIASNWKFSEKNTILCRIPDFLHEKAKKTLDFQGAEDMLAAQVFAALSQISISKETIIHFHSWETGTILSSEEIKKIIGDNRKIFSPYLTIARLSYFISDNSQQHCTLTKEEADIGTHYEKKLLDFCDEIVCESKIDADFYQNLNKQKKVKILSYVEKADRSVSPVDDKEELVFIAGGRPVYEKGFVQLCESLAELEKWGKDNGHKVKLIILCREYKRISGKPKGEKYIEEIESLCKELNIENIIEIKDKVSIGDLKKYIENSTALIVPSLYDPFCLMPLYALDVNRVSFVSKYAGISENIKSEEYIFDPYDKYSLLESIKAWKEKKPEFIFNAKYESYKKLYLK